MTTPLHVTSLGLVCPVGLTPASAAAAMRAGVSRFTELPHADQTGEAILGAVVPGLSPDLRGRRRLVELLAQAFQYSLASLPRDLSATDLPIILCVREPALPANQIDGVLAEASARLAVPLRCTDAVCLPAGPVGVFEAFIHARALVRETTQACLVAAVDSLVDARTLSWLDRKRRLKTALQSDGLIPGEAAGVALVSDRALTGSALVVRGLGFAVETATALNHEPLLGKGMTVAVRGALDEAGVAMHEVDFRLSDVAGESYAFEELVLAQARVARQTRSSQPLWHPADMVGDCGAASGLVQLSWVEQAFARGYAPGPISLLHASAAAGGRAAAVVGGMKRG